MFNRRGCQPSEKFVKMRMLHRSDLGARRSIAGELFLTAALARAQSEQDSWLAFSGTRQGEARQLTLLQRSGGGRNGRKYQVKDAGLTTLATSFEGGSRANRGRIFQNVKKQDLTLVSAQCRPAQSGDCSHGFIKKLFRDYPEQEDRRPCASRWRSAASLYN